MTIRNGQDINYYNMPLVVLPKITIVFTHSVFITEEIILADTERADNWYPGSGGCLLSLESSSRFLSELASRVSLDTGKLRSEVIATSPQSTMSVEEREEVGTRR